MFVTLLAVAALATPESPESAADPYRIYERAREMWTQQSYPDPLQYRITVRVAEGSKIEQEHYEAQASRDGDIRERGVSEEEATDAHKATGINTDLTFKFSWEEHLGGPTAIFGGKTGRHEQLPDYLGVPLISPMYDFGLTARSTESSASASSPTGKNDGLHTIATVQAINRPYDVVLVGREPIGPFDAYHLRLTPRRDPQKYRLRDLWIDAYTYSVLQLVVQGNFTNAPMSMVPWLVTFQTVDGLTYIDTESAQDALVFNHDRTFTSASISFDEIEEPDSKLPVLPYVDANHTLREP
jgi:hypothetical protein